MGRHLGRQSPQDPTQAGTDDAWDKTGRSSLGWIRAVRGCGRALGAPSRLPGWGGSPGRADLPPFQAFLPELPPLAARATALGEQPCFGIYGPPFGRQRCLWEHWGGPSPVPQEAPGQLRLAAGRGRAGRSSPYRVHRLFLFQGFGVFNSFRLLLVLPQHPFPRHRKKERPSVRPSTRKGSLRSGEMFFFGGAGAAHLQRIQPR